MIKIYYEDTEFLVCEKPYGISSQKSEKENLVDILSKQVNSEIYPIHRLDIGTTGLIVYAKNQHSAGALSKQIVEGVFKKAYICLCHGITEKEGKMRDFLYHDRLKNKSFVVKNKRGSAKEAILEYSQIGVDMEKQLSLLKIRLYTGRTHQIRVQLSSRGFVLYGDGKYGAKDNDKIKLHSYEIELINPKSNEKMIFKSLPEWAEQRIVKPF